MTQHPTGQLSAAQHAGSRTRGRSGDDFAVPMTRGEAVARRLRDEILAGALPPGAPLRDAELAQRLGVSITPVRESVATLVAEGLIEVMPNKRRRVAVLTQRRAEELMDVLGVVIIAGCQRLPLRHRPVTQVAEAAGSLAEAARTGARSAAEPAFEAFMRTLFASVDQSELRTMAESTMRRAVGTFRLYPAERLLPHWAEAFDDATVLLRALADSAGGETCPADRDAVVARLREFFRHIQDVMRSGHEPDEVFTPGR